MSINLNELMSAIVSIRDTIDKVEAKGNANMSCLIYAYNTCNELLKQLGQVLEEVQKQAEESKKNEASDNVIDISEVKEEN